MTVTIAGVRFLLQRDSALTVTIPPDRAIAAKIEPALIAPDTCGPSAYALVRKYEISSQLRKTAIFFKASGTVVVIPGAANTPSAEKPRRRASAQQPRAREASVLEREAARAEQIWLNFKALREAAAMPGLDQSTRASLSERAWELVDQAEPVRVRLAARWLGLSDTAARNWIEAGLLEPVSANGRGPLRVTMASIAEAKEIVDELRALGEDRNLVQLVLARIEGEELAGDRRFGRSLGQMARSQRGEWPEGF